ncbi:MAG: AraC family transcriptional regulator [Clostridia bacterium]|nr:AraC family transcriptional regulator [Clostridia bacterium]
MSEMQWLNHGMDELYVCQFGEEACQPGHSYGPAQRDHVLIHFVASGKGTLYCQNQCFPVSAGQGFVIYPGEESFYQADGQEPWHYAWVGFRGTQALSLISQAGLRPEQRVYTATDAQAAWQTLEHLRLDARTLRLSRLAALGGLLRFLALLAPANDPSAPVSSARQYCERAIWFLQGRYDRDVSIEETAEFAGLSRSHLYRVMMAECGLSPKEMLLRIRMQHAEKLLTDTSLTLDEIASRVGLRTGAQLGVCFRSVYGTSPGRYRKARVL